jgi:flagellar export protein FliJ
MPVSRALRRLLHLRTMEEEQRQQTLESALSELHALEHALTDGRDRERLGQKLLVRSFQYGEISDRKAAQVEIETAARCVAVLAPRIAAAGMVVSQARQAYLDKRLERRQAQILIEEAEAQEAAESARQDQQSLDEMFGTLRHHKKHERIARDDASPARSRPFSADLERERP